MNGTMQRLLTALAISALVFASGAGAADASAVRGFSSTYNFDYILWGASHFHVSGDGTVTVVLRGTSGPSRSVNIKIERETCGFFGCHWDEHYVGGTCTRTLYLGGTATCRFSPGNDSKAHRIVLSKRRDGDTIKGSVRVA